MEALRKYLSGASPEEATEEEVAMSEPPSDGEESDLQEDEYNPEDDEGAEGELEYDEEDVDYPDPELDEEEEDDDALDEPEGAVNDADNEGEGEADEQRKPRTLMMNQPLMESLAVANFILFKNPVPDPGILVGQTQDSIGDHVARLVEERQVEGNHVQELVPALKQIIGLNPWLSELKPRNAPASGGAGPSSGSGAPSGGASAPQPAASSGGAAPGGLGGGLPPRRGPPRPAAAQEAAPAAPAPPAGDTRTLALDHPDEDAKTRRFRKLFHSFRVQLLRTSRRIQPNSDAITRQVLQRMAMVENARFGARAPAGAPSTQQREQLAREEAERLDRGGSDMPDCTTILCIGPQGAGKTSTILRLLHGHDAELPGPFTAGTSSVKVYEGRIDGIRFRFVDTPGLRPEATETGHNYRTLATVKRAIKQYKPQHFLYVDRMDAVRRDFGDLPMVRSITSVLGKDVWWNTLCVLTHCSTSAPEGNQGPLPWETYAQQRWSLLLQCIRSTAQDGRIQNMVALAENHPACSRNAEGEAITPTGTPWRRQLLMVVAANSILTSLDQEVSKGASPAKSNQQMDIMAMLGMGGRPQIPVHYLITQMINPRQPRRPPDDEKELKTDTEIAELPVNERKEEVRKRREVEKQKKEEAALDDEGMLTVAPEPPVPPTFEHDCNSQRYRYLENQAAEWRLIPVMEQNGMDHDDGVAAVQAEQSGMLRPRGRYVGGSPYFMMAQVQKTRDNLTINGESEVSVCHYRSSRKAVTTTTGADYQTIGQNGDMLWTLRSETRFKHCPKNKVVLGGCVARMAEGRLPRKGPVALGIKVENRRKVDSRTKVWVSAGYMTTRNQRAKDAAKAANAELRLKRGLDDSTLITVGGSALLYRKDLALGGNVQVQHQPTAGSRVVYRGNLNTKGQGQVSVRLTSTDYVNVAYTMALPVLCALWGKFRGEDVY